MVLLALGGTMWGDNQLNTHHQSPMLNANRIAVVSDWDESTPGFEAWRLLRNPEMRSRHGESGNIYSVNIGGCPRGCR